MMEQEDEPYLWCAGVMDINKAILDYSFSNITFGDFISLYEYSKTDVVVELGTNLGTTTVILAANAKHVHTIDIFEDTHRISDPVERERYTQELERAPRTRQFIANQLRMYAPNVEVIKSLTVEAAQLFAPESVDMIFIDADHSYDGACNDFSSWYNIVKRGGHFLFHDCNETFAGVLEFTNKLAALPLVTEIPHKHHFPTSIRTFRKV